MTEKERIKELFSSDIYRQIEEVIKVDQTGEEIIHDEIQEYVVTGTLRDHYRRVLDRYWETKNKPHEGVGIWVSGFFGSGKSSFAKMLGLAIEDREILGEGAAQAFGRRTGDQKTEVLLEQISEQIPTEAVIFDVSTDRGIKSGSQTLTEIMYRMFLQHLGYAGDLDLAELEITLGQRGEFEDFKQTYRDLFEQDWDENKALIAFSLGEASAVMHRLYPDRYSAEDSWIQAAQDRADITPGRLAERCTQLLDRHRPDQNLIFVVDEVGQFVARDVQKMLDLQAVVQSLGRTGRGRIWLVVTSQEKLTELVGGIDDHRVELARLMDRFPLQVHLEPSDISEVTSKRVLAKTAEAERTLRDLYQGSAGRLQANTRLTADIQLPDLTAERFTELYPLLPYQIDLIIQVVSGLRMQGGASKHVGGANRTIIKLAQQLLVHEAVGLAEQGVGTLARVDQIYDLVSGNVESEIRGKISSIREEIAHPMAQPVAKAICLLQYVQSVHRTEENIAAVLHPGADADSVLPEVKDALQELLQGHKVRVADGQYRIPTPVEDDWETTRSSFQPRPGDVNRIHARMVQSLWEPKPSHNLLGARVFKGGLVFNGRSLAEEDIDFHAVLAEEGDEFDREVAEARRRSRNEQQAVFWVGAIDDAVDRHTVEFFRSEEILSRKERGARSKTETALVAEEKQRQRNAEGELRRLIKEVLLGGTVFFRGNDRSPHESSTGVGQAAGDVLAQVLPEVFDRFEEAAVKVSNKELDALMTNQNLHGLPTVFADLGLLADENGQPVFRVDSGPLKEVLDRIRNKTEYGETATGRFLAQEFGSEPYGWSFDAVRLFVVSLLRAGKIKATSQGTVIESALSIEARRTFSNNSSFRAASFQERVVGTTVDDWLKAEEAFGHLFGKKLPELESSAIAASIRREVGKAEELLRDVHGVLLRHNLPGDEVLKESLDHMRAVGSANEDDVILNFNSTYREIEEAIKRATELNEALTESSLQDLKRAREVLRVDWEFLRSEDDLDSDLADKAEILSDLLGKETFYKYLPDIEQATTAIQKEYEARFRAAVEQRAEAYENALEKLRSLESWSELNEEQQERVAKGLIDRASRDVDTTTPISLLRADTAACSQLLKDAIKEMSELIEGNRFVALNASDFFGSRIDSAEQLEAAVEALKNECLKLLAADKQVLIQ